MKTTIMHKKTGKQGYITSRYIDNKGLRCCKIKMFSGEDITLSEKQFYNLYLIVTSDVNTTTYEDELVADTSNYDGEWLSYSSNNRW